MIPKLSVVLTTYDRNRLLSKALASLLKQKAPKSAFEVIVVDNSRKALAKDLVEDFSKKNRSLQVVYRNEKKAGLSYAKNLGIKTAKADWVAFIDDDAKAQEDWVFELIKIVSKEVLVVGGQILPSYQGKKPDWFKDSYEVRSFGMKERFLDDNEFFSGSNMAINKSVFKKTGEFDANLGMKEEKKSYGEETALQIEVVKKFGSKSRFYNPRAVVKHLVPIRKMSLWYFAATYWNTGMVHNRVFLKDKVAFLKAVIKALLAVFKIVGLLALIAMRDKKKYKYWQNYLIEKVCPNIYELGVVVSFLKL